jgi:hypothetical protein
MGTMMFGGAGFEESQRDHCMCIAKDAEISHYSDAVETFYSKHAPTMVQNAAKAVAKYSSSDSNKGKNRFSKLWYDLHKKYTHAIAHTPERKLKKSVPTPTKKEEL